MEWSKRAGSSCTCYCSAASWNFGWTQELGYSFLLSSLHYVCKKAVKQYNSVHVWSCGELLMTPVRYSVERILCETEPDYRGIIRQWTHQNSKISWSWHLDFSYVCVLLSPWFDIDFMLVCSIICKETSTRVPNVAGNHNLWISFYGLEMTTTVCTWVWMFWGHRILKWLSSAVFLEKLVS